MCKFSDVCEIFLGGLDMSSASVEYPVHFFISLLLFHNKNLSKAQASFVRRVKYNLHNIGVETPRKGTICKIEKEMQARLSHCLIMHHDMKRRGRISAGTINLMLLALYLAGKR
jgi:hypothetical protein